jgi:uncharacterized protein YqgC (DUF456 family)
VEILYWSIAILLILTGLVGSFVPLLPGTTLIMAGALLQKWLLPDTLGWTAVGWIIAFWVVSVLADIGCTVLGTKLFGGGKWGMAGASGGRWPACSFRCPRSCSAACSARSLAEKWLGKRTTDESLRAGAGAAVGFLLSTIAKLACALAMIALYAASVWSALRAAAPW